jgi:Fe2+ transport system protein FeoA
MTAAPAAVQLPPVAVLRPLSALTGGEARVVKLEAPEAEARRLMSLGLCVGRRVHVIKSGDPLIVRVVGAQVGLSARLAANILVQPATSPRHLHAES